jgi:hypothetical protein
MKILCAVVLACVACGGGGGGDDDDDSATADAASVPDATPMLEICDESTSGSSADLDCAAFCAPVAALECSALLRQDVCAAVCDQMKSECAPRFDHFVDCSGPVPDWTCAGPSILFPGVCASQLDCPCLRDAIEGCAGAIEGVAAPGVDQRDFVATQADCLSITSATPDPDACAAVAAAAALMVDLQTEIGGENGSSAAFLTFALDDSFTAGQVTAVTLRLATGGIAADSYSTGEVWEVAPFVRADLFTGVPAKVGVSAVAADLGAAPSCTVLEFPLALAVAPSSAVYLGVFPVAPAGVDYFALGGEIEPTLRLTLAP